MLLYWRIGFGISESEPLWHAQPPDKKFSVTSFQIHADGLRVYDFEKVLYKYTTSDEADYIG